MVGEIQMMMTKRNVSMRTNGGDIGNDQEFKVEWKNNSPMEQYNHHKYSLQKGKDNQKTFFVIIILILTIALIALSIWSSINILSSNQTHNKDSTESDEYLKLQNSYNDLNDRYDSLENSYREMGIQNNFLQATNNNLEYNYDKLETQYNTLQSDYYNLSDNHEIKTTLGMGHLLNDYYEVVREETTPTGWWIYQPSNQDFADFAANIAEHGLGTTYWPDLEDEFYQKSERAYGSKIHSYEKSLDQLNAVKNLINVTEFDDNTLKIDRILDFINDNIYYEPDMDDNFLAPLETLSLKSGDCEDYSILAGALFELVGIESAIAIGESSGLPHAYVLVNLENLGSYGNWYYEDLTDIGLSSGKWIKIEPQARIEQQYVACEGMTLNVATEISG
jgi:hypothetical protein